MAIRVNPMSAPALAAYSGNRIGNLGLDFGNPGAGQGAVMGGVGSAIGNIAQAMQGKKAEAAQAAQQDKQFQQKRTLQSDRIQAQMAMQQKRLAAQKEAKQARQKEIIDKIAADKAGKLSKQKIEKSAAAGMMYLNSPEIQKNEEATKSYVEGLVKNEVFNEDQAETFLKASVPQRHIMAKIDLISGAKATQLIKSRQKDKELAIEEGKMALTGTQKTREQESSVNLLDQLNKLESLSGNFSDEYLTALGRTKDFLGKWTAGMFPDITKKVIGEESTKSIQDWRQNRSGFMATLGQFFASYVKEMTGVQFGMKEFEMRKKEVINAFDDPDAFKGKLTAMLGDMKVKLQTKQALLKEGLPLDSEEFRVRFQERVSNIGKNVGTKKESSHSPKAGSKYSQEDLEYTAKQHGISVDEVIQRLGGQ